MKPILHGALIALAAVAVLLVLGYGMSHVDDARKDIENGDYIEEQYKGHIYLRDSRNGHYAIVHAAHCPCHTNNAVNLIIESGSESDEPAQCPWIGIPCAKPVLL